MQIEVGICKTCKHYECIKYDPSPAGVALSPSTIIDCGCLREDDFVDLEEKGYSGGHGEDSEHQCPLWEMMEIAFCFKHGKWHEGKYCSDCEYEAEEEYERLIKGANKEE